MDTSIGLIHIGQFQDDKHSSRLLTTLAHYPPALVSEARFVIYFATLVATELSYNCPTDEQRPLLTRRNEN